MELNKYLNMMVVISNRDGDKIRAKIIQVEKDYVILRFESGIEAKMNTDNIENVKNVRRQSDKKNRGFWR